MTTIRAFFSPNWGTFFQFSKKGWGDLSPLPPLVTRLLLSEVIMVNLIALVCTISLNILIYLIFHECHRKVTLKVTLKLLWQLFGSREKLNGAKNCKKQLSFSAGDTELIIAGKEVR